MSNIEAIIDTVLQENSLSKDTFCLAPYHYFDFDQSGEMHTCFKGKKSMGNWKEENVLSQFNSDEYKNLRTAQRQGDKTRTAPNCEDCYKHEAHKVWSLRKQILIEKYNELGHDGFVDLIKEIKSTSTDKVDTPVYDYVEMRLSNYCNLRCLHCDQRSSTQWMRFLTDEEVFSAAKKNGLHLDPNDTSKNIMQNYRGYQEKNDLDLDDIVDIVHKSKKITLSGGEPLIDPNYFRLMDRVIEKHDKDFVVHKMFEIHTNLNVNDVEKYFAHWKKFNKVKIFVSLDVPPSTYRYFRRNGDWQLVANNIDYIKKYFKNNNSVNVYGHITFNFFGAMGWRELCDTWHEMELEANSSIVTQGPTSAMYLPDKIKSRVLKEMEAIINDTGYGKSLRDETLHCYTYLKNTKHNGDTLHEDVEGWCKLHDKKTNLQTLDFYPQLEMYYNNNNDK